MASSVGWKNAERNWIAAGGRKLEACAMGRAPERTLEAVSDFLARLDGIEAPGAPLRAALPTG